MKVYEVTKIYEIEDAIRELVEDNQSEDLNCSLIRSGDMSNQMMKIAEEIERELDDELMDECDESFREAA